MKKISVCVLCYNHEAYIAKALDSIIEQETNGLEIEIIVGCDLGTDNSDAICEEYGRKYPFIKVLNTSARLGMEQNLIRVLKSCSGDFVAFCDGDDYWTDKQKLVTQVSAFERLESVEACYHNVQVVTGSGYGRKIYPELQPEVISFQDLLTGQFMKTCSLVIRNRPGVFDPIINGDLPADDTSICFLALEKGGTAQYIDRVMSVYRIHEGGVWSMVQEETKLLWAEKSLVTYLNYYTGRFNLKGLDKQLRRVRRDLAIISFRKMRFMEGVKRLLSSFNT